MAEPKTRPTTSSVQEFIEGIIDNKKRQDCRTLRRLMEDATNSPAVMWGSSIVGFGSHKVTYSSGKHQDWMKTGFSPRKEAITLYMKLEETPEFEELLNRLGNYKRGRGCLYIKKLMDVDLEVLNTLIHRAINPNN